MTNAFLSLGSNLGDRKRLVDQAVTMLTEIEGVTLKARSSYYRTAPVGPVPQEWFLNIAIWLQTEIGPGRLHAEAHRIETSLGRDRSAEVHWGPRPIDIDLIAYGEVVSSGPGLVLPHPRFAERAFVLTPLNEICPMACIAGRTVSDYSAVCGDSGVERLGWLPPT